MERFLKQHSLCCFITDVIVKQAEELFFTGMSEVDKVKAAYIFVRDEILHSFDCDTKVITAKASDVLRQRTGLCHTKANLLAALLR